MEELIHEADSNGRANTKYRGVKPIVADSIGPDLFRLRESGRGGGIETFDMNRGRKYSAAVDFIDSNNYWDNYNADLDEVAGDAHFGAEQTYDYFKSKFNRNSFDDNGAKIRSFIHYGNNYVNAFWNGFVMTYGDGNGKGITPLTTVDICGHEIAHAVTTYSAGLIYRNESGALNESFSDIFGNAIEWFADSTQFSWRMGEDIMASKNGIRNMANPKTHRDPHTYKGQYWYSGTGDNGGVHTNSGVQNYWFYLLCEGKTGTNDNNDNYQVDSIGIHKAEQIAYRNLTVYLTNSSDYEEARYYGIQSAGDLYGYCSKELEATTNAWYAVGVGQPYDSSAVSADFTADSLYCQGNETVRFVNRSLNAKSFVWSFGDGDTSHAVHPTHEYGQQGSFTVSLAVESCYNGFQDTLVRTQFITIDSTRDICSGILMPYATWDTVRACSGFVYDHAGESNYTGLHRDTLTIDFATSDSALLTFLEFDYETNYDSVYVYDGYSPSSGNLIGGFTGTYLPNNGNAISLYSGAVTLVHFSDPFVVGTGFKARFEAKRPALSLTHSPDTTACFGTEVHLSMKGSGGDPADHYYSWNSMEFSDSISFIAQQDTSFEITFGDLCMREFVTDSIHLEVLDPITFSQSGNPTLCQGQSTIIWLNPRGGKGVYDFTYSDGGGAVGRKSITRQLNGLLPGEHPFWVSFTDQCTPGPDTAFYTIRVRDSLSLSLNSDTTICMGTTLDLQAFAEGGNGNYSFVWDDGTSGSSRVVRPGSNQSYAVTLKDGCSRFEPKASLNVTVLDSLKIEISSPDLVCYGETTTLTATVTGGLEKDRIVRWANYKVQGLTLTKEIREEEEFIATVEDGCSVDAATASALVLVRTKLSLKASADQTVCDYDTSTLSVVPAGGISENYRVTWNQGLPDGLSHEVSPSFTTVYLATLRDGCSDSATAIITIEVHDFAIPDFEVDPEDVCLGDTIKLSNTGDTGPGYSHAWDVTGQTGLTGADVQYASNSAGVFDVELKTTTPEGCIYILEKQNAVEVWENPRSYFEFDFDTIRYTNQRVQTRNRSSFGRDYTWLVGDEFYSSESEPLMEFDYTGINYANRTVPVTLIAMNEIGCSDTLSKPLTILGTSNVFQANAFTPDGDGLNDDFGLIHSNFEELEFWITNRLGVIVFQSESKDDRWDGTTKGKLVQPGLYNLFIRGTDLYGNPVEEQSTVLVVY
jgi:gliding motility-associated-like protein